tara:strand:+ start:719 stop:2962 length:2244 start_codon:yes stop_codon:yes gene_type:complete
MKKLLLLILIISNSLLAQDTLYDCLGSDVTAVSGWLGDGWCDDGAYTYNGVPVYFDCEEFNYDEGDCEAPIDTVPGCTDLLALNFVPEANFNDGSCEYPIFGCIDPEAPNYNPWAGADDGSCVGISCSDGEAKIILQLTLDQYPGETGWIITDLSNGQAVDNVVAGEYTYEQANQTIIYDICIPETGVEIILSDIYGDGLAGSLWGGTDGNIVVLGDIDPCGSLDTLWALPEANFGGAAYSGPMWIEQCDVPAIEGCTNSTYVEFNPQANLDNGSCETLHTLGCINPNAFNYDSLATLNSIFPTCSYTLVIEDDGGDGWGDCYIGLVQEDSILGTYTMGPGSYSQEFNIILETDKPVKVYYFEIANPQTPPAEVAFQTMHNSFKLINSVGDVTLQGGVYPFANNGQGALKPYAPPFWHVYNALPFCGDYCIPKVYGCLEESAINYMPEANTDDGSCIEAVYGCTNELAFNYDSLANVDNGGCVAVVVGCMDSVAWNYNFAANVEDGSCIYFGCMDPLADNYDSIANVDNGTCFITVLGCTDETAFNYDPEANTEDFSCIPIIYGCLDSLAFNWDSLANTDNNACIDVDEGCMDPLAYNYSIFANTEDGSCLYDAGCVGEPGEPYWLNDTCYAWVIMIDPYCCNNEWDDKCQELYWSCGGDSELSLNDISRETILIYPNPTYDIVNIVTYTEMSLEVFDAQGRLVVLVKSNYLKDGENQLDVSQLPAGIYNFNITCNNNTISKKVIKR